MRFIDSLTSSLLMAGACAVTTFAPAMAQGLPSTGTYFITNVASGEALQPNGPTAGQNVFLVPYNKSGRQKWVLTRQVDLKTHKPTDRYLVRLAGEDTTLVMQPHPVSNCNAIITPGKSLMQLKVAPEGFAIRSVDMNGDAMCAVHVEGGNTETHFKPDDGSAVFRWKLDTTD